MRGNVGNSVRPAVLIQPVEPVWIGVGVAVVLTAGGFV